MIPFLNNDKLSETQTKIARNVFWAMLGKVVNLAGALLVGILVARYLGPENYGLMNYVLSYVAIFAVIAIFGLDNIEIRELSRHPERKNEILGTSFRLRLVFATIAFILIIITLMVSHADVFTSMMIIVYSFSLFTACFSIIRNYFTSIVENEFIVKAEITRSLIGYAIKIILLLFKAPVEYFVYAMLFDAILLASGYIYSYKAKIGNLYEWKYDKKLVSYMMKESFPLLLSGAAVVIYQRIDQVMIGNMISKESVGYFATAGRFVELILFLPTVLVQTVTPLVIKVKENGSEEQYNQKKKQFVGIVTWTSIFLAAFFSIMSYWLIRITFGTQYLPAVPVLQIMSWKTLGLALSSSAGQIIIMEGIQKWAVIKNLIGCVCCVVSNYLLLPVYGIVGSAWVTIATTLIAGWIGNILIPPYHRIFKLQLYAVFCGWKELRYFKSLIKR